MAESMMNVLEIIEQNLQTTAGELLLLTEGEFDSYRVAALVRVCRDTNLREQADAFLARERIGMSSPSRMFSTGDFVDYLVSEGAVERVPFRETQVADDMDCLIATPKKDRPPEEELAPLPYEWAEAVYDTPGRS